MGRGRAKAKQVKVARQLKYNSGGTNLDRLQTELSESRAARDTGESADVDVADRYGYFEDEDEDESDEDE